MAAAREAHAVMAECTIEDLRAAEGCPANLTAKQIAWAQLQMLCSIAEWIETGEAASECDLEALIEEGRCSTASLVELEYWKALKLCGIVTALTSGGVGGVCGPFMLRLKGNGSPEGVQVGCQGQHYLDLDTGADWVFAGVNGSTTGWL